MNRPGRRGREAGRGRVGASALERGREWGEGSCLDMEE